MNFNPFSFLFTVPINSSNQLALYSLYGFRCVEMGLIQADDVKIQLMNDEMLLKEMKFAFALNFHRKQ